MVMCRELFLAGDDGIRVAVPVGCGIAMLPAHKWAGVRCGGLALVKKDIGPLGGVVGITAKEKIR